MKNYSDWNMQLTGRCQSSKKVGNNTSAIRRTETVSINGNARIVASIVIRLHNTDVVTFHEDGRIVLNSGGWRTSTTKDRINKFCPVRVSQSKGVWSFGYGSLLHLFADGVTLHPDGSVTGAATPDAGDADKALRKQIGKFAKLVTSKLPLPLPDAGDCLFCQASRQGQPFGGTEHLKSHMEEGYVVPSLVYSALEFAKCGELVKQSVFASNGSEYLEGLAKSYAPRAVRKYLLRQFALA